MNKNTWKKNTYREWNKIIVALNEHYAGAEQHKIYIYYKRIENEIHRITFQSMKLQRNGCSVASMLNIDINLLLANGVTFYWTQCSKMFQVHSKILCYHAALLVWLKDMRNVHRKFIYIWKFSFNWIYIFETKLEPVNGSSLYSQFFFLSILL